MKSAASDRASSIFLALSRVPIDERPAWLDAQCAGDAGLRAEVDALREGLDGSNEEDPLPGAPTLVRRDDSVALGPGTLVGDFVVVRQIGAGGTGVVYLAHQRHPPRVVALKVLRREFVASAVQRRFEVEAELLAQLHHPGIAQIFAAHSGDAATPPFIAIELVNGPPITEYADAQGLTVRERADLLARVCDAVQHAHQRRVIHRDLKPANILVGEGGEPKVVDFGVARRADVSSGFSTAATETGQLLGTLAYMSPEQILADPGEIDTRTDIHALGVVLFRLLAGRLPFAHGDPSLPELARRILEEEPPRLGTLNPELRGDIEIIAARAMAKEKERRYPSAAGLAADLRRYVAGQPISASSDSAWYLVRRRIGRYRAALGLSAAALVAVGGLAFYASVQRERADRMNVQLEEQLSTSTIERGRLVSLTGNHPVAEELVWRELFRHPESIHARWTLWDIYSREPSLWSRLEHVEGAQSVRFSPDGQFLVTGGRDDGEVHLVAAASGDPVRRLTPTPRSGILRTMFTPDGTRIVAASVDGTLRAWETATGRLVIELPRAAPGIRDAVLVSGGAHIATIGTSGLHVWPLVADAPSPRLSVPSLRGSSIAARTGGTLLAIGGPDGSVVAVDLPRGAERWRVHGHMAEVFGMSISPDGGTIISGGLDGFVRMWTAANGAPISSLAAESGRVRRASFDPSGTLLVVGGQWRTRVWNMRDPALRPRDLGGSDPISDFHISPDGRRVVTANGGSGQLRMWDLAADSRVHRWGGRGPMTDLTVADGGRTIVAAGMSAVSVFEPGRGAHATHSQTGRVHAIDVSGDNRWLVAVGPSGTSAVWNRQMQRVADLAADRASRAVAFAENDSRIIVGLSSGEVRSWDWSEGRATNPRTLSTGDGEVVALAVHGPTLYTAHGSRAIVMRDISNGREIRRMTGASVPFSIAVAPDGRILAAGTYLSATDLWDTQSGQRVAELKGQTAMIAGVDVSPDGTLIASASRDGSTRLWSVRGQLLTTVATRSIPAVRARFLPDGRRLAIAYDDGEVEIRDLDYYFRYAAGQAEYQLRLLRQAGESFPRAHEVLAWSRRVLSR